MKRLRERITSSTAAGQAWVEFGLVLPILLIVVIGLFDIGRAFFTLIAVTNASREGTRYLSLHPEDKDNIDSGGNRFAGTREVAARESIGSFVTIFSSDVTILLCLDSDSNNRCDNATPVRVRVTKIYRPIFAGIFPSTFNISRETEMMVP